MARTTLNSHLVPTGVALSGGNLIATSSTAADHGACGAHTKLTGKWYFEVTFSALGSGNSGAGIAGAGATYANIGNNSAKSSFCFRSSNIYVDGVQSWTAGTTLGGNRLGVAVDLDNKKIYYRVNGGVWNSSQNGGADNPATNSGGIDITGIIGAGVVPACDVAGSGDVATFNFGATSYGNAAPSGFSDWDDATGSAAPVAVSVNSFNNIFTTSSGSAPTVVLHNIATDDIVVFNVVTEAPGASNEHHVTSITGGSLAFTKHTSHSFVGNQGGSQTCEVWWAHATSDLVDTTFTVNLQASAQGCLAACFSVSGADTTTPFDTNGAIPGAADQSGGASNGSVTISTTSTNGLLIGLWGNDGSVTNTRASTAWMEIYSANDGHFSNWDNILCEVKSYTAAQSSLAVVTAGTTTTKWGMVATAIKQASTGVSGTLAATETADTFAGSSAPSGSWASTEAKDTFAGAGYPQLKGSMAATETKDTFAGTGVPGKAFGIDGFTDGGTSSNGTSLALTLTTTVAHDVIVVCVSTKGGPVTSISDTAGLPWTKRTAFNPASTPTEDMEIWWAHAPAILTADVITIHTTSSSGISAVAFGVNGANTGNPFDAHNANSVTTDNAGSGNPSRTITTNNAASHTLIFGVLGSDDGGGGVGSGGGNVSAGMDTFLDRGATTGGQTEATLVGYKIVSTAQTALSLSFTQNGGTFNDRFLMADAIVEYVPVTGTLFASDVKDTFAGVGYPQMIGSWHSTEAKDVWAGTGTVPPFGPLAATEAKDTMGFTGDVGRPLGIDASAAAVNHDTTTCSVAITTTAVDDVIVLGILCGGFFHTSKVATITDTHGLVWKRRQTRSQFGTNPTQEIWWAKKHATGPTTITVTTVAETGFICVDAIAVSGARADAPWDTHSGAGVYNDNFGSGNPTGTIFSNSSKCMGLAFFGSNDINTTGTLNAGWTYLDTLASGENSGQTGRVESAYQIFNTQQRGTTTVTFGQVGGGSLNRCIMQDVIVSNNDTTPNAATADVIRWFFDGHGNQMILAMSGSSNSATKELTTFNHDTTVLVAAMVTSSRGTRVDHVSDSGNHSGWTRRSIVTNDVGTTSLELWWVQMADPFSGTVTVTLDSNVQPGDIVGFIVLGINGPDVFQRGEIFDGHSSLPATKHSEVVSNANVGPFSTLNENVLEIAITANTSQDPTGFEPSDWLQFIGNFFGSVSGELVSHSPLFNIALQAKFSGPVVINDSMTMAQSPSPANWLMLADALPVGPVSPPQGVWGSTEAKDITTHTGDFTRIGIASPGGWVGFPPNHAAMAATDQKDRATNTGAFTAIWDTNGWIGFVPLHISWASIEFDDIWASHGWVLGPTTILARWESVESKDSFGAADIHTWYTTPDSAGDRTSRIIVTTNASLGGSSGVPETLVNGLRANNAASAIWVNISQPAAMWFQFDFGSPKVVNEALWFQNGPSAQPGLWKWQGSNDAASWTDLSATFALNGGNSGSPVLGDFSSNQTAYRYYRILQTTNAGGNDTPWLWEIEFKVAGFSGTMGAVESKDRMNYQVQLIPTATPIPARKRRLLIVT